MQLETKIILDTTKTMALGATSWLLVGVVLGWTAKTLLQKRNEDEEEDDDNESKGSHRKKTDKDDDEKQLLSRESDEEEDEEADAGKLNEDSSEKLKMVLCVRMDLGMGKGKMCSQCAHAAVGACEQLRKTYPRLMRLYTMQGQAKIVLRIPDEQAMMEVARMAKEHELPSFIVCDAGRTQIAANTRTVIAIGPAPTSKIDQATGHLKLL